MKSTGVVRKLDPMGRVTLPKELRDTFGIKEEDGLEIFTEGKMIILRKYVPGCVFCNGLNDLKQFGGEHICSDCRNEMRRGLDATRNSLSAKQKVPSKV